MHRLLGARSVLCAARRQVAISPPWLARPLSFGGVPRKHASITLSFSRSSGPGGQNVNKVSTKAEVIVPNQTPPPAPARCVEHKSTALSGAANSKYCTWPVLAAHTSPLHIISLAPLPRAAPSLFICNLCGHARLSLQLRLKLEDADWLPEDMRRRLWDQQPGRINKQGELLISTDAKRSQKQNVDLCFMKLKVCGASAKWC